MKNTIIENCLFFLDEHNIKYELLKHKAVFTVEDVDNLDIKIDGVGVKTLFLRDNKKKNFYLVAIEDSKKIDLTNFSEVVGKKKISFASEENLDQYLQVKPGSISPMALINDKEKKIKFYIDEDLIKADKVAVHPNLNTATIILKQTEFQKYLNVLEIDYEIINI